MQAKYTDLIVFNKWELVDERRYEDCHDRVGDLDIEVATVKSDRGFVSQDLLLGLDSALAKSMPTENGQGHDYRDHDHAKDHESEVEVLSLLLSSNVNEGDGIDPSLLDDFLRTAPKDEIYRIKGITALTGAPSQESSLRDEPHPTGQSLEYILNWAFGRWTFTKIAQPELSSKDQPLMHLTIVTARGESDKWKKKLLTGSFFRSGAGYGGSDLQVSRIA